MMTNIKEIKIKREHGDHVVDRIEQMVEYLNDEVITNVAVVMVTNKGEVIDCWANGKDVFRMVGALDALKFEFTKAYRELRNE